MAGSVLFSSAVNSPFKAAVLCSEWNGEPSRPILAVGTINGVVCLYNEEGEKIESGSGSSISKTPAPNCLAWHPSSKMLAIGWRDGNITIWFEGEGGGSSQFRDCTLVHDCPIQVLKWSPSGNRLVSADQKGMITVWKIESRGRLSPVIQYTKNISTTPTHCVFFSRTDENPNEPLPAGAVEKFAVATNTGQVYVCDDQGLCVESFNMQAPLAALLYHHHVPQRTHDSTANPESPENQESDAVVVMTTTLSLAMFQIMPDGSPNQLLRVKVSSSAASPGAPAGSASASASPTGGIPPVALWVGRGLLATLTNETMVRVWDLLHDDNYSITPPVENLSAGKVDRMITMAFNPRSRMLTGCTREGRLYLWQFIGSAQSGGADDWEWWSEFDIATQVNGIQWGPGEGLLSATLTDGMSIVHETSLQRSFRKGAAVVQTALDSIAYIAGIGKTAVTSKCGIRVKGVDVYNNSVCVWNGKAVEIHEASGAAKEGPGGLRLIKSAPLGTSSSPQGCAIGPSGLESELTLFASLPSSSRIDLMAIPALARRQSLPIPDAEGPPVHLHMSNSFLAVATANGYVHVWDVSRREPKSMGASKKLTEPGYSIASVRVNCTGAKVAFLAKGRLQGSDLEVPDTRVYTWDVESDRLASHDLAPSDRLPVGLCWDENEPKLLAVETKAFKPTESTDNSEGVPRVEVSTFFTTPDSSQLMLQDSAPNSVLSSSLIACSAPSLLFVAKSGDGTIRMDARSLRDFDGIPVSDEATRSALLSFSYYLTLGNMDEAYKAVKAIKDTSVWGNMAHMCVKTKRLDVAHICFANTSNAFAARALRLSKAEPELEARVGVLAVQIGLLEEAEKLFKSCKRFDLLNQMYQSCGRWDKAIETAEKFDRIHLRATHHMHAKHLEASGEWQRAIRSFELAKTHKSEVPRMLFDLQNFEQLQRYVENSKDKDLYRWWAQYCESNGSHSPALHYYGSAGDWLSVARIHCYLGDVKKATEVALESQDPAACYHVARQLEDQEKIKEAMNLYTSGGSLKHALRLAKENHMDTDVMALALQIAAAAAANNSSTANSTASSTPSSVTGMPPPPSQQSQQQQNVVMLNSSHSVLEAARYFEDRGMLDKAVLLYQKGGDVTRAIDLCFSAQLFDVLSNIAESVNASASPQVLSRCAEFFATHGQHEKAVRMLIAANQFEEAIRVCMERNVKITEDMAEQMTLPKSEREDENAFRNQLLLALAKVCKSQGSFHLACKKYTQAGDKIKAMKALIKSGDTEKICFFAGVSRQREIYILAANYLQNMDWHNDPEILKNIITFYTKAKALDNLAAFYDSCAQVEIDEYRDYEKALNALKECVKYLQKGRGGDRDAKLASLRNRIYLVDKFVQARSAVKSDPNQTVSMCHQLLEERDIETALRIGDVYALLVELHVSQNNYEQAYHLVEKMRERGIILSYYLDHNMVESIYTAMGVTPAQQDEGEIDEEVAED